MIGAPGGCYCMTNCFLTFGKNRLMTYLNINSIKAQTYDAIVVGTGISGGWAAKELNEKGLKTLVLERGRDVKHIVDYPTTNMLPWEFEHLGQPSLAIREANPMASQHY